MRFYGIVVVVVVAEVHRIVSRPCRRFRFVPRSVPSFETERRFSLFSDAARENGPLFLSWGSRRHVLRRDGHARRGARTLAIQAKGCALNAIARPQMRPMERQRERERKRKRGNLHATQANDFKPRPNNSRLPGPAKQIRVHRVFPAPRPQWCMKLSCMTCIREYPGFCRVIVENRDA